MTGSDKYPIERECTNVEERLSLDRKIVGYTRMSLRLTLSRNEKVEQHIKKTTYKPNIS